MQSDIFFWAVMLTDVLFAQFPFTKLVRRVAVSFFISSGGTHISQVEGDLQVIPKRVREVGIHVQHFQQVVPQDLVKVAVGQGPDVSAGLPWSLTETDRFSKDVILS